MKNLIITVEFAKKLRDSLTAFISDTGEDELSPTPDTLAVLVGRSPSITPVDIKSMVKEMQSYKWRGKSGLSQPTHKTADRVITMRQLLDSCPDDVFMPDFDVTLESTGESPVGTKRSTISRMSCS